MLSYFGDARPGLFRRKQREPCHHLARPATAKTRRRGLGQAWGTDNGEPQTQTQRTPAWKPQRICKGKMGCDASEVDHRWTSPLKGERKKHMPSQLSLTVVFCFFFLFIFFSPPLDTGAIVAIMHIF